MNTSTQNQIAIQEPIIRHAGGKFTVKLASVGNPDHGQDPDHSVYGVPNVWAHIETLAEAREICEHFIAFFNLGGGNWSGGEVVRHDGLVIGRFSYNGRLWSSDEFRKEIIIPQISPSVDSVSPVESARQTASLSPVVFNRTSGGGKVSSKVSRGTMKGRASC